jgi:integral membrane sensor domain MASE1
VILWILVSWVAVSVLAATLFSVTASHLKRHREEEEDV